MDETVETGFDAVFAGEKWEAPPSEEIPPVEAAPVTAAVTPEPAPPPAPSPAPLSEEGKQALKSLVSLPLLSYSDLAALARAIAMDIKERHVVLQSYGLNEAQYEYLETFNPFYIQALKAACIEWHAPLSTQERIKLEAAAILEDSLPGLGARLQNRQEQLTGVVEAAKLFAKVAGVGERETGSATPGERFVINIDLGGDQKVVVSSGPAPGLSASDDKRLPPPDNILPATGDTKV